MTKQLAILALVLAVLVALLFLFKDPRKKAAHVAPRPLLNFAVEDVGAFQVNHFIEGRRFEKQDGRWLMRLVENDLARKVKAEQGQVNLDVDQEARSVNPVEIAKILAIFTGIRVTQPIATHIEDLKAFEINEYSLHVIFYDQQGKELERLYIGKSGPDVFSSFVKKADEDALYLIDQNLGSMVLRNDEDWLTPLQLPAAQR